MSVTTWKMLPPSQTGLQSVWRKWDDGREDSCLVTAEEYVKWLEAGNTPQPADEVTE